MSRLTQKSSSIAIVLTVGAIFLGLGLIFGPNAKKTVAGENQRTVSLGMTAEQATKVIGNPVKISYDSDIQHWFYLGPNDTIVKKLSLNQGVVVETR